METNGAVHRNGTATGTNGLLNRNESGHMRDWPPTVDEALPFSPFSSVVPFNSDIVPFPSVGLRSSASLFSNDQERGEARRGLESLNHEVMESSQTSQKLEQALQDLKQLLEPQNTSQYVFKTAPRSHPEMSSHPQPKLSLAPFSQLVYDNVSIDYSCPSPTSVTTRTTNKNGAQVGQAKHKSPTNANPTYASRNEKAYHDNSTISVEIPVTKSRHHFEVKSEDLEESSSARKKSPPSQSESQTMTPPRPTPRSSSQKSAVVIPASKPVLAPTQTQSATPTPILPPKRPTVQLPTQVVKPVSANYSKLEKSSSPSDVGLAVLIPQNRSDFNSQEYALVPDSPGTPTNLSMKRKQAYGENFEEDYTMSLDQREKADQAFDSLRSYLVDVFEAENQWQSDKADLKPYFMLVGEDGICLTTATQSKVESLLQKMISVGRFSQVPMEDLVRIQKLSETALKHAENMSAKVEDDMTESDVEDLMMKLSIAELGLKSARTVLRIMSGGREEKQIYSEGVISSALNVFRTSMETFIIPVVEMRCSGASSATFKLVSAHKKTLANLLHSCRRVFTLLATLVAKVELTETVVNTLEFIASRFIFVENAATEKDSIIGIGKFDSVRVVAMDVLAQIFLNNPSQRQGIFDEILTSLEKLPVTKQSARQFKLADGGTIQLVSALIMRLVQTSASKADDAKTRRRNKALESMNAEDDEETVGKPTSDANTINSETRAASQPVKAIQELRAVANPLIDIAKSNATYVVGFIVNRAMKSTKSGDTPYRNLLDLFVEDFTTCLNSVDWPAAELLLRLFLFKMVHLAEGDKTPAPAKNMALDLLGTMGAAISELISHVRKSIATVGSEDDGLARYISRLAEVSLQKTASLADIVSWECGPFRLSLQSLEDRCSEDSQLSSSIGYYMAEWASKISTSYEVMNEDDEDCPNMAEYGKLAYRLRMMIVDKTWLSTEYSFQRVSPVYSRLAYSVSLLHSQFCESFGRVLHILLESMSSEQATVRSKGMKSVNQVLDTDPTILDREPAVKFLLSKCSNDPSVLVRDSALTLIGKCIGLRSNLESDFIPSILQRVNDSGVGVRKRAMKLSKDIYLRNSSAELRSAIADSLLHRVTDQDQGVQDLARLTIEEVWMAPFYHPVSSNDASAAFKLAIIEHVALMVKTVQRGSGVAVVLDKVLQNMLSGTSKNTAANFKVCKTLVATMFETFVDNSTSENTNGPSARDAIQVLTIFARSSAKLFTPEQIQLLQPYIANVGSGDDLAIYRSVVIIFRHVLPHLSKVHVKFLVAARTELLKTLSRMGKAVLDDVVACLWIISEVLDDFQNIVKLVVSSLTGIQRMRNSSPGDQSMLPKLNKLLLITGMFGKHCNLEPQYEFFKKSFPTFKGDSVSRLMVDTFAPFAAPELNIEARKAALDAIGMVCQSWSKNFASANIITTFQEVFTSQNFALEAIILRSFKDFLFLEEKRSEIGSEGVVGAVPDPNAKLAVMGGGQGDGIALGIAQRFLKDISRIALASQDDQGLLATEIIASIARQGLVHPKECGSTLIALETSQNSKIADLAFRGHRSLHEKHETILEKEYTKAVRLAYIYQRDVCHDSHGATLNPFTSKLYLMIEVLKISKVKNRKRVFDTLCEKIDFNPAKMTMEELPKHLDYAQFLIENLAFFDYATVDELLGAIASMERVVAGTGTSIAHAIESEIFQISIEQPSRLEENGQLQSVVLAVNPDRLLQLCASSMMLSCLWETRTYLRRQYSLSNTRRETKGKGVNKDLNKTPVKVPSINGDKFWDEISSIMSSLESEDLMLKQCHGFVETLNVDPDFKVAAEGDDENMARLNTPSDEDESGTPGPSGSGRGRKRKGSHTPSGRKQKRARSSSVVPRRGSKKMESSRLGDEEDAEGEFE